MNSTIKRTPIKGRGALNNIDHRFTLRFKEADPAHNEPTSKVATTVLPIRARSVITRNRSPDISFNLSVNPYQGCEHGCVYCFARPTHAYHDLSPGLDFETRILAKTNAAERLREELAAPGYHCEPLAIGFNTDAYQPAEKRLLITRSLLEVCLEFRQPVALISKSAMILRDLDLLKEMAALGLVRTAVSVTTLDNELKRRLEPRTAGPDARLNVIQELAGAGVPVSAMVAPVIPRINDHEIEHILKTVAERGAATASYVLLRLPWEVEPLFRDWLAAHYPDRAEAVMKAVASCRGGKSYDARFFTRLRGEGPIASMIAKRFEVAARRHGLSEKFDPLRSDLFRRPADRQISLF